MKVLIVNGSPKTTGGTGLCCDLARKTLTECGIESEIINLGTQTVNDCIGCQACHRTGSGLCEAFKNDIVNEFIEKAKEADGFIFAAPVYYAHPARRILTFLDRVFYANSAALAFKPASSINISRRAGGVTSMDVMNKYMTINQMPVVSSTYWNEPHGDNAYGMECDYEGTLTVINMAKNMAWLLKCIEAGKKSGINHPENEKKGVNYVR